MISQYRLALLALALSLTAATGYAYDFTDTVKFADTCRPILDLYNGWTASGTVVGGKYEMVDEVGANDGTATRLTTLSIFGDERDTINFKIYPRVKNVTLVDSVALVGVFKRSGVGTGRVCFTVFSDNVHRPEDSVTLSTSYAAYRGVRATDVETGVAFTMDSLRAYWFGFIAVTMPSINLDATQFFVIIYGSHEVNAWEIAIGNDRWLDSLSANQHLSTEDSARLYVGGLTGSAPRRSVIDFGGIAHSRNASLPIMPDSTALRLWFPGAGNINAGTRSVDMQTVLLNYNTEVMSGHVDWVHIAHTSGHPWFKVGADSAISAYTVDGADINSNATTLSITNADTNTWLQFVLANRLDTLFWRSGYVTYPFLGVRLKQQSEALGTARYFHSEQGDSVPVWLAFVTPHPPVIEIAYPRAGQDFSGLDTLHVAVYFIRDSSSSSPVDLCTAWWKPSGDSIWSMASSYLGADINDTIGIVWLPAVTPNVTSACSLRAILYVASGDADTAYLTVDLTAANELQFPVSATVTLDSIQPDNNQGYPIIWRLGRGATAKRNLLVKVPSITAPTPPVGRGLYVSSKRAFIRAREKGNNQLLNCMVVARKTTTDWVPGNESNDVADSLDCSWNNAVTASTSSSDSVLWTTGGGDFDNATACTSVVWGYSTGAEQYVYFDVTHLVNGDSLVAGFEILSTGGASGESQFYDTSGNSTQEPIFLWAYDLAPLPPPVTPSAALWSYPFSVVRNSAPMPCTTKITGLPGQASFAWLYLSGVKSHSATNNEEDTLYGSYGFGAAPNLGMCISWSEEAHVAKSNSYGGSRIAEVFYVHGPTSGEGPALARFEAVGTEVWLIHDFFNDTTATKRELINGIIFGGTDVINTALFAVTSPNCSDTCAAEITTPGFRPDIVFFLGTASSTAQGNTGGHSVNVGWAISAAKQGVMTIVSRDNVSSGSPTEVHRNLMDSTRCYARTSSTGGSLMTIRFDSMTALGFAWRKQLPVSTFNTNTFACLAVQGGNWDGGVLTQPTGAAPQTTVVSTQWQPESMFMLGTGRTATTTQTALESHAMMNFGVANMTTDGRAMSLGTRQLNPSFILVHDALDTTTELARTYDVTATPPVAPVARAQWTATTASSFTLTWNSTDATARKWFYIIAAPESAEVFPPPKGRKRRIQFGDVGAFDIGFNAIQEIAK